MKESALTRKILKYLNSLPETWAVKIHGSIYQQAGLPDILGIKSGRWFFIEVKTPEGRVSRIQEVLHEKIWEAGGRVYIVHDMDEFWNVLGVKI